MMYLQLLPLSIIFIHQYVAVAQNATVETIGVGNANEFIDEAITHWRSLLKESGYDPLFVKSFTQGRITCNTCRIEGLSSIKRTGDVMLNTSETFLVVDINIGLAEVSAHCNCEARWAIFSVDGIISGTLTDYSVDARIEQYAINDPRPSPQLTSLLITNEGQLTTHFDGSGFLGTVLQWFGQDFIRNRIRQVMTNASEMRQLLSRALVNVDLGKALSFN